MIYVVLFFYPMAHEFMVIPYWTKHDACRTYVESESTPKAMFAVNIQLVLHGGPAISCTDEDYTHEWK